VPRTHRTVVSNPISWLSTPFAASEFLAMAVGVPKVELVLYVSPGTAESERMLAMVNDVLGAWCRDEISFCVRDVAVVPRDVLDHDHVASTPMLIMNRPLRLRLGPLVSPGWLQSMLALAEVQPRRVTVVLRDRPRSPSCG